MNYLPFLGKITPYTNWFVSVVFFAVVLGTTVYVGPYRGMTCNWGNAESCALQDTVFSVAPLFSLLTTMILRRKNNEKLAKISSHLHWLAYLIIFTI